MKKKIFIAIFFIMICLPSLGMFFYKTDISAEKREVQTFPKVKENGKVNMDFFNQLSDYFSDNFAFRQQLIETDAVIKKNVFKAGSTETVLKRLFTVKPVGRHDRRLFHPFGGHVFFDFLYRPCHSLTRLKGTGQKFVNLCFALCTQGGKLL